MNYKAMWFELTEVVKEEIKRYARYGNYPPIDEERALAFEEFRDLMDAITWKHLKEDEK